MVEEFSANYILPLQDKPKRCFVLLTYSTMMQIRKFLRFSWEVTYSKTSACALILDQLTKVLIALLACVMIRIKAMD